MFFDEHGVFSLPAYPTNRLIDPTGCGDSFAGGFMGYVASQGKIDHATFKRGMGYGTVVASLNVEDFSLRRMLGINRGEIDARFEAYRTMLRID